MRPSYLLSLTKRTMNADPSPHNIVARTKLRAEQPLFDGLKYSDTCATTSNTIGVEEQRRDAFGDNATPPGITQGRHLLHPRTTTRVPDLEKVRYTQPTEWLEELRNPSLVLAVPNEFAAPRPVHARKIARENFSAIIDHEWEYREGSVRLVNTDQSTGVEDYFVSNHLQP